MCSAPAAPAAVAAAASATAAVSTASANTVAFDVSLVVGDTRSRGMYTSLAATAAGEGGAGKRSASSSMMSGRRPATTEAGGTEPRGVFNSWMSRWRKRSRFGSSPMMSGRRCVTAEGGRGTNLGVCSSWMSIRRGRAAVDAGEVRKWCGSISPMIRRRPATTPEEGRSNSLSSELQRAQRSNYVSNYQNGSLSRASSRSYSRRSSDFIPLNQI